MSLKRRVFLLSNSTRSRCVNRGRTLRQTYKIDFVCFGKILLELKAVSRLTDEHRAQTLNYLHTTGLTLGLLLNFGHHPKLEHERFALSRPPDNPPDFYS